MDTRAKLTDIGKKKAQAYIEKLIAKRKEILDAKLDTDYATTLPTVRDIANDIGNDFDYKNIDAWVKNAPFTEMEYSEYSHVYEITDNNDADGPLVLIAGEDFTILPLLEDFFKWDFLISDDDDKEWWIIVENKGQMPYEMTLSPDYMDDVCCRVEIDGQYYYFGDNPNANLN